MIDLAASLLTSPWAIRAEWLPIVSRVLGRIARGEPISDQDRELVADGQRTRAARRSSTPQYAGAVAVVPVYGVLLQRGGFDDLSEPTTSMMRLASTIRALAADRAVSAIVLDVDSPGGSVYGLQELSDAIYGARAQKPIAAVANSMAASAAYWTATQAGELYAAPGAEVGSIGVFTEHWNMAERMKQLGVSVEQISAGKYKTERNEYGPLSDEARAAVQASVDQYYDAFVRAVARGRGASLKAVREGMGQGRVLQGAAARAENMIDGVRTLDQVVAMMQARAEGRDNSRAGMSSYLAQQLAAGRKEASVAPASSRAQMQRDLDVLEHS